MAHAWTDRAAGLAALLAERGDLHARWRDAVAAVPRHVLVPTVYQQDDTGHWRSVDTSSPQGLDLVYSPATLVTSLVERDGYQEPVSSSTKPDLMVRMLELLDVRDGNKVLEIGTGSGYNAALLSHRLGDDHVFSIDVDDALVSDAIDRLAGIGFRPTLVAGDGAQGLAEHAPFDRIIATCSVRSVPWRWAEQLCRDGLALVDIKLATSAGNLALLRRFPDRLEGRFTTRWAAFMLMRHHNEAISAPQPRHEDTRHRTTTTPPQPWADNRVVWFLAQLHGLPRGVQFGMTLDPDSRQPTASLLSAPDGSRATVGLNSDLGTFDVTEAGPTPLWEPVERAHEAWLASSQPDWTRIGTTVTPDEQWIWIDSPDARTRWRI